MKHYKHMFVVATMAAASTAPALGAWVWDFNNASAWGSTSATSGTWYTAEPFGGFVGRSFNTGNTTSSYEATGGFGGSGGMRYTATGTAMGGMRLATSNSRDHFQYAMHRSYAPSVSVRFLQDGPSSGMPIFYTYAVLGGNPQAAGNGTYVEMRLDVDYNGGEVYGFESTASRGNVGLMVSGGWNLAEMKLTIAGKIEYWLNGTKLGETAGTYEYLANAADSAVGIYSSPTLWSTGPVNVMFDDFTVTSSIPAPGALALLGVAGLAGARRRRA